MLFEQEKLSPSARQRVQQLMKERGWSFEKAINDVKVGDKIEVFEKVQVARTL